MKSTLRDKLTPLEECCVQNYVANGGDQSKAFRECHKTAHKWKDTSVNVNASKLFSQAKVRLRVEEVADKLKDKYGITAEKLIRECAIIALADRTELFDDNGQLKPFSDLDPDLKKLFAGFEITTFGEEGVGSVTKVKTWDKMNALEKLFKNKGLFEKDNNQRKVVEIRDYRGAGNVGNDE